MRSTRGCRVEPLVEVAELGGDPEEVGDPGELLGGRGAGLGDGADQDGEADHQPVAAVGGPPELQGDPVGVAVEPAAEFGGLGGAVDLPGEGGTLGQGAAGVGLDVGEDLEAGHGGGGLGGEEAAGPVGGP